jgi:hypothetical protein
MLYHLLYHLQSWGKFDFYDTETRVYSERKLGKLSVSDQEMHSTIVGLGKLEDYSSDCGRYHCEADSCFEDMRDRKSQAGLNLHNWLLHKAEWQKLCADVGRVECIEALRNLPHVFNAWDKPTAVLALTLEEAVTSTSFSAHGIVPAVGTAPSTTLVLANKEINTSVTSAIITSFPKLSKVVKDKRSLTRPTFLRDIARLPLILASSRTAPRQVVDPENFTPLVCLHMYNDGTLIRQIKDPQTNLTRDVTPAEKAKFMIQERLVVNNPDGICTPCQERGNHVWTVPDSSISARNMRFKVRTCMECILSRDYIHTVCFTQYLDELDEIMRISQGAGETHV